MARGPRAQPPPASPQTPRRWLGEAPRAAHEQHPPASAAAAARPPTGRRSGSFTSSAAGDTSRRSIASCSAAEEEKGAASRSPHVSSSFRKRAHAVPVRARSSGQTIGAGVPAGGAARRSRRPKTRSIAWCGSCTRAAPLGAAATGPQRRTAVATTSGWAAGPWTGASGPA